MMDAVFQRLFHHLAGCIDEMGSKACQDGLLFGLRGVPDYLFCLRGKDPDFRQGRGTTRWEPEITDEIVRRCDKFITRNPIYPEEAVLMFDRLPRGKKRWFGDLLISLDGCIPLFVECKSIFECVLKDLKKKPMTDNKGRHYRYDYSAKNENILTDPKHAMTCVSIEEAWIDARKLNCLWRTDEQPKHHLGLLLLEFDRKGHDLSNRLDYKDLEAKLHNDGWLQVGHKSWPDKVPVRADKGFQEHMVLWVKLAGGVASSG